MNFNRVSAFVPPSFLGTRSSIISVRSGLCQSPRFRRASVQMSSATASGETQVLSSERASKLPWKETIADADWPLLFMPFVTHQLSIMEKLGGLEDVGFDESLSYQESKKRPARIESWLWKTDKFRKIRASYIDAGVGAQVFNSVWYPSPEYDLPLLGIDFLSFGKKKVLCVLDFQPLVQEKEYLAKYCEPVGSIKSKYEGLSGSMSARFYDEAQFFSRQLIFAKFDNTEPITTQLLPAFKEYLQAYTAMMDNAEADNSEEGMARVLQLQKDYDQYSAERDPAVGLFSTYWGTEWASRFTHEFLFSDSTPVVKDE